MLGDLEVPLSQVALLFSPVRDGVFNFDNTVAPGVKDGVEAVDDPHFTGFPSAALSEVHRFGHDAAKVLFAPAPAVHQAFGEQQWRHLDLLSH